LKKKLQCDTEIMPYFIHSSKWAQIAQVE